MKKFCVLLAISCLFWCCPFVSHADIQTERYQPDADALKNRIFSKQRKSELGVLFAMSTNDAFYQNYFAGLSYGYHITEWFSIGVLLNASFQQETGLTKTLKRKPAEGGFDVTPDVRRPFYFSMAALEARFAPVYGKLNLFSETVVHYDLYLMIGGGLMLTHPPDVTGQTGGNPDMKYLGFHPFGAVGLGQRYFLLQWLALRWEFRALFTYENFEQRGNETRFRMDMAINLGLSFFF